MIRNVSFTTTSSTPWIVVSLEAYSNQKTTEEMLEEIGRDFISLSKAPLYDKGEEQ